MFWCQEAVFSNTVLSHFLKPLRKTNLVRELGWFTVLNEVKENDSWYELLGL